MLGKPTIDCRQERERGQEIGQKRGQERGQQRGVGVGELRGCKDIRGQWRLPFCLADK